MTAPKLEKFPSKFTVFNSGRYGGRLHLVGELRPRYGFGSYDAVRTIFGFLHHMAQHHGPVMAARWKAAEKQMIYRYCVLIPHLKSKRQRL